MAREPEAGAVFIRFALRQRIEHILLILSFTSLCLTGLPQRFVWRDREYTVAAVLAVWKEDGPCRHGSGEMYLRKHWFKIATHQGPQMTLCFERQARSKRQNKLRWWLFTIECEGSPDE